MHFKFENAIIRENSVCIWLQIELNCDDAMYCHLLRCIQSIMLVNIFYLSLQLLTIPVKSNFKRIYIGI